MSNLILTTGGSRINKATRDSKIRLEESKSIDKEKRLQADRKERELSAATLGGNCSKCSNCKKQKFSLFCIIKNKVVNPLSYCAAFRQPPLPKQR